MQHSYNMNNNKSSNPPRNTVNLKQLPPTDPLLIMNSFYSKGQLNNSGTRAAAAKVVMPRPNNAGMELIHSSDEGIVKNPNLEKIVVEDSSSILPNKNNEICGNTSSQTLTASVDEGMKKGSAWSNLYEICAANHWKPPIFECYKEEGPSNQIMFTFKVAIEIEEASKNIRVLLRLSSKKKTAADHTAEGILGLKVYRFCYEEVKNQ